MSKSSGNAGKPLPYTRDEKDSELRSLTFFSDSAEKCEYCHYNFIEDNKFTKKVEKCEHLSFHLLCKERWEKVATNFCALCEEEKSHEINHENPEDEIAQVDCEPFIITKTTPSYTKTFDSVTREYYKKKSKDITNFGESDDHPLSVSIKDLYPNSTLSDTNKSTLKEYTGRCKGCQLPFMGENPRVSKEVTKCKHDKFHHDCWEKLMKVTNGMCLDCDREKSHSRVKDSMNHNLIRQFLSGKGNNHYSNYKPPHLPSDEQIEESKKIIDEISKLCSEPWHLEFDKVTELARKLCVTSKNYVAHYNADFDSDEEYPRHWGLDYSESEGHSENEDVEDGNLNGNLNGNLSDLGNLDNLSGNLSDLGNLDNLSDIEFDDLDDLDDPSNLGDPSNSNDPQGDFECCICFDKHSENNTRIKKRVFTCKHIDFHTSCLRRWLATGKEKTCPMCRASKKPCKSKVNSVEDNPNDVSNRPNPWEGAHLAVSFGVEIPATHHHPMCYEPNEEIGHFHIEFLPIFMGNCSPLPVSDEPIYTRFNISSTNDKEMELVRIKEEMYKNLLEDLDKKIQELVDKEAQENIHILRQQVELRINSNNFKELEIKREFPLNSVKHLNKSGKLPKLRLKNKHSNRRQWKNKLGHQGHRIQQPK